VIATTVAKGQTPGFIEIFEQRSFWGHPQINCSNYLLYFMVTWLPLYLVREQH
jgi:hypothetical protein